MRQVAISTSSRSGDSDPVAAARLETAFAGQYAARFSLEVAIFARSAVLSAKQPIRSVGAAFREDGYGGVGQQLNLAVQAIAAVLRAGPA